MDEVGMCSSTAIASWRSGGETSHLSSLSAPSVFPSLGPHQISPVAGPLPCLPREQNAGGGLEVSDQDRGRSAEMVDKIVDKIAEGVALAQF